MNEQENNEPNMMELKSEMINLDQEQWLTERIASAIRMSTSVRNDALKGADHRIADEAVRGIIKGTVKSIGSILSMYFESEQSKLINKNEK